LKMIGRKPQALQNRNPEATGPSAYYIEGR
jgi:hypothetical protein